MLYGIKKLLYGQERVAQQYLNEYDYFTGQSSCQNINE